MNRTIPQREEGEAAVDALGLACQLLCIMNIVAVVGIVTRRCNGVANKPPLFFSFKTITSYKNSGSKPVKTLSVVAK
jgi:hypothetical protein